MRETFLQEMNCEIVLAGNAKLAETILHLAEQHREASALLLSFS